ncbi:MAG: FemAB family XrtA/PEP-CTERM system-associated protein [Sphingobium sp.]
MKTGNRADMSVVTLELSDVQQAQAIDAFVLAHPRGTPFHRPAWLAGVEAATGNRALVFAAVAPSDRIVGLLPLHHVKSRLFGQAMVSTAFAVDGGILADDPSIMAALAAAAQGHAIANGGMAIELHGGPGPEGWQDYSEHVGFVRPLGTDDEAELLAVPRKHRAELRKAIANPALRVEIGRDRKLIRDHYRVYSENVRNLGTPVFPARLFREMLERFDAQSDILVVYDGDRPVSAVLSLYYGDAVMPYWGGGVQDARRLRSNELMYYRLMSHARRRGVARFDFGRSKVGSGQAAWKKSFGFVSHPLHYHVWSPSGAGRDINPNNPKYQRRIDLWKKLPLPVANLIGPFISRGLG